MESTSIRVLLLLEDTDDSVANLNALRLHRQLVGGGHQVRTLALAPGAGHEVTASVPAMAPSRRSLAAVTQLQRELTWPDVLLIVDCVPRLLRLSPRFRSLLQRRAHAVTTAIQLSRPDRGALLAQIQQLPPGTVSTVIVNDATSADAVRGVLGASIPVVALPHPSFESEFEVAERVAAARRAAREAIGASPAELIVVSLDPKGALCHDETVSRSTTEAARRCGAAATTGRAAPLRYLAPDGSGGATALEAEVLAYAADLVVTHPLGAVPAGLVDLMAIGVLPLVRSHPGGSAARTSGEGRYSAVAAPGRADSLLESGRTALLVGATEGDLVDELALLGSAPSSLVSLSAATRERAHRLAHPETTTRQWSNWLTQALPSHP